MNADSNIPLVTVVIPTYNRMPFIIEAVNSVIAQTYSNWELIIVDDGSTDRTAAAIRAISDERIHVIELNHEGMIGSLRNTGVQIGDGEWISFLDSDDVWLPHKLEMQVMALQHSGFQCCYTNYELMNERGETITPKSGSFNSYSGNIIRPVLTNEASVCICTLIVSREVFNHVGGFSTELSVMNREDYEFTLRLARHTNIFVLSEILVRVREHSGRRTNAIRDGHESSALAYSAFIRTNPGKELERIALKEYARHMAQAAKKNFKAGRYSTAISQLKNSLIPGISKRVKHG